ncbi:regulatory protein ToxS [Thaumasiovibrio sp. DFM-14]|uniref:regulatory protein ToxS n=1 Tax=Thaumasiovibrio sp. DFM-14 TaxID=3384792 RepID=UPI00399FC144
MPVSTFAIKAVFKQWWPVMVCVLSLCGSIWYYMGSDRKVEVLLSNNKWQSISLSEVELTETLQMKHAALRDLKRIEQTTQVIFLPNKMFSRFTHLKLTSVEGGAPLNIQISEAGSWQVSGKYLQTEIIDFSDVTSGNSSLFNQKDLDFIRNYYLIDSKQSRKLDIIDDNTLLLTSVNNGSSLLVSY